MSATEIELVVRGKSSVAEGVVELVLARPSGAQLPPWSPGSHVDLVLPGGVERQYSLCGDPAGRDTWRVAVLREEATRGGSRYIHDTLTVGTTVTVRGPRNNFLLEPARRYRFIAGGIGITPIVTMLAAAENAGADWRLLYGGRTRASMAYVDDLRVRYGDRVVVHPHDEAGLLPLAEWLGRPVDGTLVYCCGPEPLLRAVEEHCAAGVLRVERFAPRGDLGQAPSTGFEVHLARSGLTLTIPGDGSILRTVEEAGLTPPWSCEEGICGTCETAVLSGTPDHRDSVLSAREQAEGKSMMICVSRSRTERLVLDL
ncbi:PDR/VanB family oxidoreductase [Pseudonocardia spinosispora]|uniref:PDR/VanB family oxidoreductase n=1 Tax=Pseudonocardia spinosispora TaxID=103441 RepID=UPI000422D088|nr:PDR/VanB family oxidoreductase [Pseudonocardia spinosispora]